MGSVRTTQGRGYAAEKLTAAVRTTQARGYAIFLGAAVGIRATVGQAQGVYLAAPPPMRITQGRGYCVARLIRPVCGTAAVQCWRIERTDGVVLRYTTHDRTVTLNGESYSPCASLSASAVQNTIEQGDAGTVDLVGILSTNDVNEVDLWAGRYEGAQVQVWRVHWDGSEPPLLESEGIAGKLEFGMTNYRIEVSTAADRLQQRPIVSPVMPTCRFKFGDSRCSFDVESLRVTGVVTALPAQNVHTNAKRRAFTDDTRGEAADYFLLGRLTWTSGRNSGLQADVRQHLAGGSFVLEKPMQYEIELGDGYSVIPGCMRTQAACIAFGNEDNFGGFSLLSGDDKLADTPKAKTP